MRAFVTGATGNLGRLLVEELLLHDWSVDAFVLPDEASFFSDKEGVAVYQGDIGNRSSVDQAIEKSKPDMVFHLAGYVRLGIIDDIKAREQMHNTNVEGTRNVLESALKNGVDRAVYISSVAVYGVKDDGYVVNERTLRDGECTSEYEKTKQLAYQEAMDIQKQGLRLLVFVPGIIIGPDFPGTELLLEAFLKRRIRYLPEGLNENKIPLVFVYDLLQAISSGIEQDKFGEEYILVESSPTPEKLLEALSAATGEKIDVKLISNKKVLQVMRLREIIRRLTLRRKDIVREKIRNLFKYMLQLKYQKEYDTSKARRELNWEPHSLNEALQEIVEWFFKKNAGAMQERK